MIIVEQYSENLERRFSDLVVYMQQAETGFVYSSAIDVIPCRYTYIETDIPIPPPSEEEDPELESTDDDNAVKVGIQEDGGVDTHTEEGLAESTSVNVDSGDNESAGKKSGGYSSEYDYLLDLFK